MAEVARRRHDAGEEHDGGGDRRERQAPPLLPRPMLSTAAVARVPHSAQTYSSRVAKVAWAWYRFAKSTSHHIATVVVAHHLQRVTAEAET